MLYEKECGEKRKLIGTIKTIHLLKQIIGVFYV